GLLARVGAARVLRLRRGDGARSRARADGALPPADAALDDQSVRTARHGQASAGGGRAGEGSPPQGDREHPQRWLRARVGGRAGARPRRLPPRRAGGALAPDDRGGAQALPAARPPPGRRLRARDRPPGGHATARAGVIAELPYGGRELAVEIPDERVADVELVVDDLTRPTPISLLLPPVVAELRAAGVPLGAITVLVALGTHRPMTDAELAERLGGELT